MAPGHRSGCRTPIRGLHSPATPPPTTTHPRPSPQLDLTLRVSITRPKSSCQSSWTITQRLWGGGGITLQVHSGYWQNPVPCSYRSDVPDSFLAACWDALSASRSCLDTFSQELLHHAASMSNPSPASSNVYGIPFFYQLKKGLCF